MCPQKITFQKKYIDKLTAYSSVQEVELKIAVYWTVLKMWTLIPVVTLKFRNNKCVLKFDEALAINEMFLLGDQMLGTTAPLKIKLISDMRQTTEINDKQQCNFVIGKVELYAEDRQIQDEIECNIAFKFVSYLPVTGKWEETENVTIDENKIQAIEYSYSPRNGVDPQGFEMIGMKSSIISNNYDEATTTGGGVDKLSPNCDPAVFEFLIPKDFKGKQLKLWQFILHPNTEYESSH